MAFKVPDKAKQAFSGMASGGSVQLPFACPPFFVVNGDAKLAPLQNVQYYGGWGVTREKMQEAVDSWENLTLSISGLQEMELPDENGNMLNSFASRSLFVAPICIREYSSLKENGQVKRVAPFTKGARPGIQVVAVLGHKTGDLINHWAPIMLTAKGYQVNHIKNAIRNWRKAIEPVIKKMDPTTDPASISNLFYMSIGTFGKERKVELVGTTDKKPITPITSWIPETITEEMLTSLYVGDAIAEWMVDLAFQAEEWLKVFSKEKPSKGSSQPSEPESPPPPNEDDIPF